MPANHVRIDHDPSLHQSVLARALDHIGLPSSPTPLDPPRLPSDLEFDVALPTAVHEEGPLTGVQVPARIAPREGGSRPVGREGLLDPDAAPLANGQVAGIASAVTAVTFAL